MERKEAFLTREEVRDILLPGLEAEIRQKGEDSIFMMAPLRGKDHWTLKEVYESTKNDTPLEGLSTNLIDDYIKWKTRS